MAKKTVNELTDIAGKRVLERVDFNVPMDGHKITDDTRIRESLPTIRLLIDKGAKVILASHMGRPKGTRKPELSLRPAAERLAELLGKPVAFAEDCVGPDAENAVAKLDNGDVLLLENLRFHLEEEGKVKAKDGKIQAGTIAADSATSAAATFCSRCAMRRAPGIGTMKSP